MKGRLVSVIAHKLLCRKLQRLVFLLGVLTSICVVDETAFAETVDLRANFRLYGVVNRFYDLGWGWGDMPIVFGLNSPATEIGRIEFNPEGTVSATGVLSQASIPANGWGLVDVSFSVPVTMEVGAPASLYLSFGDGGVAVVFDFSDNISWGDGILPQCNSGNVQTDPNCFADHDQGLSLLSITLPDGQSLDSQGLSFDFIPQNTLLTASASSFDTSGSGVVTVTAAPQSLGDATRALVYGGSISGATASAKVRGGADVGGRSTTSLVDLDVSPEPYRLVFDLASATVSGSDNVVLQRVRPPLSVSPVSCAVLSASQQMFTASGGVPPYVWSVSSNHSGGSIASAGLYTAGTAAGVVDTITVTDSTGATANATATVTTPVAVATTLQLAPKTASHQTGSQDCVTATVLDQNAHTLQGVRVDFAVTGPNARTSFANTAANGTVQFCYVGSTAGTDAIVGSIGTLADSATKTWTTPAPTPPSCALTAVVAGPPKQLQITVQDSDNGLKSVEVTTSNNTTVAIPTYTSGEKGVLVVVATKIDQSKGAQVALRVTDMSGAVTDCDPIVPGDPAAADRAADTERTFGCSISQRVHGDLNMVILVSCALVGLAMLRRRQRRI